MRDPGFVGYYSGFYVLPASVTESSGSGLRRGPMLPNHSQDAFLVKGKLPGSKLGFW